MTIGSVRAGTIPALCDILFLLANVILDDFMKPSVYIETTVVSYYTARPGRDLIVAARQQITRDWWEEQRLRFDLFVSPFVLREASHGDKQAAKKRLEALQGIPSLDVDDQVERLARAIVNCGGVPAAHAEDALHIAVAAAHRITYLLTWNCTHIANAETRLAIENACRNEGCQSTVICTPEELLGGRKYVERPYS
jgi:hypothetical protein